MTKLNTGLRALCATMLLSGAAAQAQITDNVVRIGVLNDQSGLYAGLSGPGSVWAARQAVKDFAPEKYGLKVEVVAADHQNKPDVGASVARRWFDVDKVDMKIRHIIGAGAMSRLGMYCSSDSAEFPPPEEP